jgi:hypothetical protein
MMEKYGKQQMKKNYSLYSYLWHFPRLRMKKKDMRIMEATNHLREFARPKEN